MPTLQSDVAHQWHIIGDVLVTFTVGAVENALWDRYLEVLNSANFRVNLAFSSNAAITAVQRKSAAESLQSRQVKAVVMTDSALTRGIVTALVWLGANIRAYSYSKLDQALADLDVPPYVEREIETIAREFIEKYPSR